MRPRIFIVHRWMGHPREGWYQWMRRECEQRDCEATVLRMPEPERPAIDAWVPYLAEQAGEIDARTFFVTHSIGAQAVMRLLASRPDGPAAGGAVFVAPWFTLKGLEDEEDKRIAAPWLEEPIDLRAVRNRLSKVSAIFSDDDRYVPLEDTTRFKRALDARVIVVPTAGHFSEDDKCKALPVARDELLRMMGKL